MSHVQIEVRLPHRVFNFVAQSRLVFQKQPQQVGWIVEIDHDGQTFRGTGANQEAAAMDALQKVRQAVDR